MQTEIIWKKQFKQSSAFNITPIADPFNPNCFYVGGAQRAGRTGEAEAGTAVVMVDSFEEVDGSFGAPTAFGRRPGRQAAARAAAARASARAAASWALTSSR